MKCILFQSVINNSWILVSTEISFKWKTHLTRYFFHNFMCNGGKFEIKFYLIFNVFNFQIKGFPNDSLNGVNYSFISLNHKTLINLHFWNDLYSHCKQNIDRLIIFLYENQLIIFENCTVLYHYEKYELLYILIFCIF